MTGSPGGAREPVSRVRRTLQQIALAIAGLGLIGVPLLFVSGGFDLQLPGFEIRAHRPVRAFWLFVIGLVAFLALGGRIALDRRSLAASLDWHLTQWERVLVSLLPPARVVVFAVAAVVAVLGYVYGTKSAAGADAYGYVSQADLWLAGRLSVPQPFTTEVPWPRARDTFTPLGYKPAVEGAPAIVPIYSPGLPLIFAAFKAVGGHGALFLVVPLLGALLVVTTYGIGCRLGSAGAGLIGALLVATSPAVLFMLMPPMTDVPVAAMWAASFYVLTGAGGGWRAFSAGLLAGIAVMIRPNLVPLAACAGLYYVPDLFPRERRWQAVRHGLLFGLGLLPAVAAVAVINNELYGSPFLSGYGRLSDLFAWRHIPRNFPLYYSWFVETQSHAGLLGLAALLAPVRWIWPGLPDRRRVVIAALIVYSLWAQYLAYLVFDQWWYLRFLLTAWPFIMVGVGAVAMLLWRWNGRLLRTGVVAGIAVLLAFQAGILGTVTVFNQWPGERRYIAVADMVQQLTPPNSVIWCMQHSGSIRYYGGRMTIRYDNMDRAWLDRAVAWLAERGVSSYLLVETWEMPELARRFPGSEAVGRLHEPPLAIYEEPGKLFLFDLSSPEPPLSTQMFTGVDAGLAAAPPGPVPTLVLPPRTN